MLYLPRHENQSIVLTWPDGRRAEIRVAVIHPNSRKVRIGIDAPLECMIERKEDIAMDLRESGVAA